MVEWKVGRDSGQILLRPDAPKHLLSFGTCEGQVACSVHEDVLFLCVKVLPWNKRGHKFTDLPFGYPFSATFGVWQLDLAEHRCLLESVQIEKEAFLESRHQMQQKMAGFKGENFPLNLCLEIAKDCDKSVPNWPFTCIRKKKHVCAPFPEIYAPTAQWKTARCERSVTLKFPNGCQGVWSQLCVSEAFSKSDERLFFVVMSWSDRYNLCTDAFRQKVEDYMKESEANVIYKHDLQAMILLSETEEDLRTLHRMIVRLAV